jgi:hypothetical protein
MTASRWQAKLPSLFDPDEPPLPVGTQRWEFQLAKIEPVISGVPLAASREIAS